MEDLFAREQQIYDDAVQHLNEIKSGVPYDIGQYEALVKEYGKVLRQLRRITRLSDRTAVNLNESKLDLLEKVHYDVLTGIYNRRFLEENMERTMESLSLSGGMLSVLMIDLDFFKRFNDTYGHSAGDECLKTIAKTLVNSVKRTNDFAARYGGEEFVVVLPLTDGAGACAVAGRLLEDVRACKIPHENNEAADCVTISIGVTAGRVKHTYSDKDYIKRADEALYMSKRSGRNRYTFLELKETQDDDS